MEATRKPQFRSDGVMHATINGHRFHLRTGDLTKDNFLWVNGRQPPLILDQTATDFVILLIEAMWKFQTGDGDESGQVINYVVEKMFQKYSRLFAIRDRVTRRRIREDLDKTFSRLMAIARGECPVEMGLTSKEINYGDWIAPARMDLALTYRCNLNCSKCYIGEKKGIKEMALEDWLKVYEILWRLGVPQIVFTGGEPTLRHDLLALVSEAEEFVTGLVTNGTNLSKNGLAAQLRDASLDYVQITIESSDPSTHDAMTCTPGSHENTTTGIMAALKAGLQVVTNTTLTRANAQTFLKTIVWLRSLGVKNIACNTLICSGRGTKCRQENGLSDAELRNILERSISMAGELGVNLDWYSPTCYTQGVNPVELGLGIKACSAAAHNMTIQPDGTVLPCQSWPDQVGNIITDSWTSIWSHPVCKILREHLLKSKECSGCQFENTCAGACPLDKSPRKSE